MTKAKFNEKYNTEFVPDFLLAVYATQVGL